MHDHGAVVETLLRCSERLAPDRARTYITWPFDVPAGAQTLRIQFRFLPAQSAGIRNLLTLTLFDPHGFRGAGHRHAPQQEILLAPHGATPGFMPGPLTPGRWHVEIDCHAVLPSEVSGVDYDLAIEAALGPPSDGAAPLDSPPARSKVFAAACAEGAEPLVLVPPFVPRPSAIHHLLPSDGWPPPNAGKPGERPRWLKGDLHVHSNHSDGRWTVERLARYIEQLQLDFVAVTDHNTTTAYAEVLDTRRRLGVQAVVIPAMELTTFFGHANALGVSEWIDWRVSGATSARIEVPELDSREVHEPARPDRPSSLRSAQCPPRTRQGDWRFDFHREHDRHDLAGAQDNGPLAPATMAAAAATVHRLGGTFVVNHPHSPGYPACTGCRWEFGDDSASYADAIEVWNGAWDSRGQNAAALATWNAWLNAGHRIVATAGSDSHHAPRRPDRVGYTSVWATPTVEGILTAVRTGAGYLSRGPHLAWRSIAAGAATRTSADTSAGALALQVDRLAGPAELRLVHNGHVVCTQAVHSPGEFTFDLPDGLTAGWYRAELYPAPGSTDLLALTNPIFVDELSAIQIAAGRPHAPAAPIA